MAGKTISVVLADDHNIVREGLKAVLEASGRCSVVAEAGNGWQTVTLAKTHEPDVVIMDVSMPDLNGIDATRRILHAGLSSRVLALTSHTSGEYVKPMLQAGARGYLLKECAASELLTAIQAVYEGGLYVSPSVAGAVIEDYVSSLSDETGAKKTMSPELSGREREVLQLIAEGRTTSTIAERLSLSVKTVESHRKRIMDKLKIRSVAGLTKYAIRLGLTALDD